VTHSAQAAPAMNDESPSGSDDPLATKPVDAKAAMTSGGALVGTLAPIVNQDVPEELRDISPADATLLPADIEESIDGGARDYYAFDSASGFDFPREHLDDDFFKRLADRHSKDQKAGSLGKFDLVVVTRTTT
jgi:hypothetical protein